MTSTEIKKQKSNVIYHRSHMTINQYGKTQGSFCKGICIKHKTAPTWSNEWTAYCGTCQIFMKKSGWFIQKRAKCKCCNRLVRRRPRQSTSKATYDIAKAKWTDSEDAVAITARQEARDKQEKYLQEAEEDYSEKKSTPIYKEEKVNGKTYHQFRNFIEKEIKLQANYQLVMLKHLLSHKEAHKGQIAVDLAHYNNKDPSDIEQVKEFLDKPVYKVLVKSGFVVSRRGAIYNQNGHDTTETLYELNGNFPELRRVALDELLAEKIKVWNNQNGI